MKPTLAGEAATAVKQQQVNSATADLSLSDIAYPVSEILVRILDPGNANLYPWTRERHVLTDGE
jgi:hypothetical protein